MVKETLMPNGVRVVTDSMFDVRSATIGFWFDCGSRNDQPETGGTAHFIEHMLFKGTHKRSAKQLALEVDCIGGQMNAFTSAEFTCYYIKVLDTQVSEAFDLLSDMLLNSRFALADIKKEKQVILQEHDMYEDNPEDFIQDKFFSYIWGGHPLGKNILGSRKSIRKINKDSLSAFMLNQYTPDKLVVAVAGNVKHEQICELVDSFLGMFKGRGKKCTKQPAAFKAGEKNYYKETEQTQIIWGVPGIPAIDKDWYTVNILNNIFGGSGSSRLFQYVREEQGLAYFIYSILSSYSDTGVLTISAGVSPENAGRLVAVIDEQIAAFVKNGVTEAELKKAKQQINSNLLMSFESSSGRMHRIGKLSIMSKKIRQIDEIVAKINAVTKDDVNNAAKKLFMDVKPTIIRVGPRLDRKAYQI